MSNRARSLLLSIASICVRLAGQPLAAEILAVAAIATITLGAQRDARFRTPLSVGSIAHGVPPSAGSSVAAR